MSELQRYTQCDDRSPLEWNPYGEWVKASDAEAALAEKDAEIVALKKRIEEMKCCGNCNQGRPDKEECAIFCKRDGSGNLDRWEARDE